MDYLLIKNFKGRLELDWKEFEAKELKKTPEELFKDSYYNAISFQWNTYFDVLFNCNFFETCSEYTTEAVKKLMDEDNIYVTLETYLMDVDELEFSFNEFDGYFNQYIENELGLGEGI